MKRYWVKSDSSAPPVGSLSIEEINAKLASGEIKPYHLALEDTGVGHEKSDYLSWNSLRNLPGVNCFLADALEQKHHKTSTDYSKVAGWIGAGIGIAVALASGGGGLATGKLAGLGCLVGALVGSLIGALVSQFKK